MGFHPDRTFESPVARAARVGKHPVLTVPTVRPRNAECQHSTKTACEKTAPRLIEMFPIPNSLWTWVRDALLGGLLAVLIATTLAACSDGPPSEMATPAPIDAPPPSDTARQHLHPRQSLLLLQRLRGRLHPATRLRRLTRPRQHLHPRQSLLLLQRLRRRHTNPGANYSAVNP